MKNERDFYNKIIKEGAKKGFLLYRIHDRDGCKNPFDIAGISDDGRAVGVEAKVVGGRLLEHQKVWLNAYVERGGIAYVVWCGKEIVWEEWSL